ncbi:hypothetical protein BC832DRAFT_592651 [Gaertneriomyces semiglobifer]|nr:hypothetical protein BC832DRAFT_592651 [Gaertneriomyces semiglobifer]
MSRMLPFYNQRELPKPSSSPVVLREKLIRIPQNADELPRELHRLKRALSASQFPAEFASLDRLRYKNSNQHRSSFHFRKLMLVRKLLQRLREVQIEVLLEELVSVMHPNKTKNHRGVWTCLPSRNYMAYVLARLISAYGLTLQASTALNDAYVAFRSVASQTYFMAVSVVAMSSTARLHLLLRHMLRDIASCYELLYEWMLAVPEDSDDEVEYCRQLPATLSAIIFCDQGNTSVGSLEDTQMMRDAEGYPTLEAEATLTTLASTISDGFWNVAIVEPDLAGTVADIVPHTLCEQLEQEPTHESQIPKKKKQRLSPVCSSDAGPARQQVLTTRTSKAKGPKAKRRKEALYPRKRLLVQGRRS